MSGLSDALQGIEDWAKAVPGAAKQAGKDIVEYPGQVTKALGQLGTESEQGFGRAVTNPVWQWLGLPPPFKEDNQASSDPQLPTGEGEIGGKKYKFSKETLDPSQVEDVTSSSMGGPGVKVELNELLDKGGKGFQNVDPAKLTDKEYDTLTKEAANGNQLAQAILVKGKYKEQRFPSLGQDLAKFEDPFVKALSGLPEMATNLQGQMNNVTQLYDFKNADNQVNTLLGQMGSSMRATASPETQSYADKIAGVVKAGGNQLTNTTAGLPSIEGALSQLGPAAKLSEKSTPEAALLAALLGHEQTQIVYGNAVPSAKSQPNWLQQLIAQVTGSALGGGLVSPAIAASGLTGQLPSTTPSPTGSNG